MSLFEAVKSVSCRLIQVTARLEAAGCLNPGELDDTKREVAELLMHVIVAEAATLAMPSNKLPPQKAVEKFFQAHPASEFKPSAVARALAEAGHKPADRTRQVFTVQIRTSCLRLAGKGTLTQITGDGPVRFVLAAKKSSDSPQLPPSEGEA